MPAPISTLAAIEQKVRRLTRSPSLANLSEEDLQQYINTFVVYDFPEQLRTFNLRTQFTFFCNPFQDVYITDTTLPTTNPLYDFQNKYISVHPPAYIAGYNSLFTQDREQLFNIYPITNSISTIGVQGNGTTMTYSGVVNTSQSIPGQTTQLLALLQNQVLFSSVSISGEGLALVDVPLVDNASGNTLPNGNLYIPGLQPSTPPTVITPENTINYITGAFRITFPSPPEVGATINSQTCPQTLAIPQAIMYHDNKFTLRPVPDQPYRINFEVFSNPVALLTTNQNPQLNEWWQYIAYGTAKKIFEDRMDTDSVQAILPEMDMQRILCNRRTIVQNANMRAATIYTEQTQSNYNGGWGSGGGSW
jgi:hypothetical protein